MSEENRKIAVTIAENTNFSDWAKDRLATDIEKALDEAQRRGAEKMRETILRKFEEKFGLTVYEEWKSDIRELPLEGPKDGKP